MGKALIITGVFGLVCTLAAGCGPAPSAAGTNTATVVDGPVAAADMLASSPRPSVSCAAWIRQDAQRGDQVRLPVPTTQFEQFDGVAITTAKTLPAWLGENPATSVAHALNGWTWDGMAAVRGHVVAKLQSGMHNDILLIDEPHPTIWQRTAIEKAGWPAPPPSTPIQLQFSLRSRYHSVKSAFEGLIHDTVSGHGSSISDLFLDPIKAPAAYETYAGPVRLSNFAKAPSCPSQVSAAPFVLSGKIASKVFWMISNANGITVGFAPGYVVVSSGHAGIITTLWYREPAIATPAFTSQRPAY